MLQCIRSITVSLITLAAAAMVGLAPTPSSAAEGTAPGQRVPQGCVSECKKQYELLASLNDFTTSEKIESVFGVPSARAKGNQYELVQYEGVVVDFFTLKLLATQKRVGVGIVVKENPAHARIPFLHMGRGVSEGDTKWYFTAKDIDLSFARGCEGQVDGVDAKHAYFWTPRCYFGKPGSYKNYSFLFWGEDSLDCTSKFSVGPFSMRDIDCEKATEVTPTGVFVSDEDDPQKLAEAVSGFVFWKEPPQ